MTQQYTSKNTSINHSTIPYLINHINWNEFKGGRCLDYGSGKINPNVETIFKKNKIQYLPYDPFWLDEITNNRAMNLYPTIVICSNVLNVIKEDSLMLHIHNYIKALHVPYFIKIFENSKTGIGCETKNDCWQRNEKTENYKYYDETIYKKIITKPEYKHFII